MQFIVMMNCGPPKIRGYVHTTRLQYIGHYSVLLNYQDLAHLSWVSMQVIRFIQGRHYATGTIGQPSHLAFGPL
jgi:hypothetical protein